MSALTSLLVRDRVVPVKKIEEAIQRQVISGGELDTVLLEVNAAPENVIASYRAAVHAMDAADRDTLMSVSRDVIKVVPKEVAEQHRVVPIAMGERIAIAVGAPLPGDVEEQLVFLLGAEIDQRLVAHARIEAALAEHYGTELTSRIRRLAKKLGKREAGEVVHVEPLDENRRAAPGEAPAAAPAAAPSVVSSDSDEGGSKVSRYAGRSSRAEITVAAAPEVEEVAEAIPEPDEGARVTNPSPLTHLASEKVEAPPKRTSSVNMTRAVGVGATESLGSKPNQPSFAAESAPTGRGTEAQVDERPPEHPLVKKIRGPFTARVAVDLLAEAEDRDDILKISFAFIRQFFDCAALFVVHDDVAEGLDVHGGELTYAQIRRVSHGVTTPGTLGDAYRLAMPRVGLLDDGTAADRTLGKSLGRLGAQPSILAPVAIRQRVVLMFYGDRGGEDFGIADVPEFVAFMPRVSEAFSQLILRRKLGRDKPAPASAPDRWKQQSGEKWAAQDASDKAPARPRSPAMKALGVPRSAPPPPDPMAARPASLPPASDVPGGPIVEPEPGESPKPSPEPPPDESAIPLKIERRQRSGGAYSMRGGVEYAGTAARRSNRPPPMSTETVTRRGGRSAKTPGTPASTPSAKEEPDQGRAVSPSPVASGEAVSTRRGSSNAAPMVAGRPSPAGDTASTLVDMAAPVAADAQQADAANNKSIRDPGMPSVILATDEDVEDAVSDLLVAAPNATDVFDRVRSLGERVFPALVREFPGPLWFDRHGPHTKLPRARDVSAIARAISSFGEVAVPYVGALLDREDTDVRFYATLLAAEIPHRDLVAPLGRRVFDIDPGTRALALDVLRPMRRWGLEFSRVIDRVRSNARIPSRPVPTRKAAVRAIGHLRDDGALDLLLRLLEDDSRDLADAAHDSLVLLTRQDLGRGVARWNEWAEGHRGAHRIEWLIDALTHEDVEMRRVAYAELKQLTQAYFGYRHDSSRREREIVQRKYREWWSRDGRDMFS